MITICGQANETCPLFAAKTKPIHQDFEDPPKLAIDAANEEQALIHYCRIRNQIKDYVLALPTALDAQQGAAACLYKSLR